MGEERQCLRDKSRQKILEGVTIRLLVAGFFLALGFSRFFVLTDPVLPLKLIDIVSTRIEDSAP